jgi:hypothetical protein
MFPFDVLLSFVAAFAITMVLLKYTRPIIVIIVAMAVGALLGWQILQILPAASTSIGWLLSGNTDMQIIWDQTHDIVKVAQVAKNAELILIGYNMLAGLAGFLLGNVLAKRKAAQ